jgi:hypothetical protein
MSPSSKNPSLTFNTVSKAYNFTASGESSYDIAAANKFQYVDAATNSLETIYADVSDASHTAAVSGELAIARRSLEKRIAYQSCSSSEKTQLVSAAAAAQSYANAAVTCVLLVFIINIRVDGPWVQLPHGTDDDLHPLRDVVRDVHLGPPHHYPQPLHQDERRDVFGVHLRRELPSLTLMLKLASD